MSCSLVRIDLVSTERRGSPTEQGELLVRVLDSRWTYFVVAIVVVLYVGSFLDRDHGHVLRRPVHIVVLLLIAYAVVLLAVANLESKPDRGEVADTGRTAQVSGAQVRERQAGRASPAAPESTARREAPPPAPESTARRDYLELWQRLTRTDARETPGHSAMANGQQYLGTLELRRAREAFLAARDYFRRDPPVRRSVEDRRGEGLALFALGMVERRAGNTDGAIALLGEAGELLRRIGDKASRLASALAAVELADAGHERDREGPARAMFLEAIASIELGTIEGALEWSHAAARSLLRYALRGRARELWRGGVGAGQGGHACQQGDPGLRAGHDPSRAGRAGTGAAAL